MWFSWFFLSFWLSLVMISQSAIVLPKGYKAPFNSTRTNFCHRLQQLRNGTLDYSTFLSGQTLVIAVHSDVAPFYMSLNLTGNSSAPFVTGGFNNALLLALAKLGNFKIQYVLTPAIVSYASRQDYLKYTLPYVDMWASAFGPNGVLLLTYGIGSTVRVLDQSLVLITTQYAAQASFTLWGFLAPFTNNLWAGVLGVILASAIAHIFLDKIEQHYLDRDAKYGPPVSIEESCYSSFAGFARIGFTAPPLSPAVRILRLGYAFFLTLLTASYTANLASTLTIPNQPTFPFTSLDMANQMGARICFKDGSAKKVLTAYPNIKLVQMVKSADPQPLVLAVAQGTCDGALLYKESWITMQTVSSANPFCNIVQVGDVVLPQDGVFAYDLDYTEKCTASAVEAFTYWLVSMQNDGSFDELYQFYLTYFGNQACPAFVTVPVNSSLTLNGLSGIFVMYLFTAAIAILLTMIGKVYHKCFDDESIPTTNGNASDKRKMSVLDLVMNQWTGTQMMGRR